MNFQKAALCIQIAVLLLVQTSSFATESAQVPANYLPQTTTVTEEKIASTDKAAILPILATTVAERVFPVLVDWVMDLFRKPKKTEAVQAAVTTNKPAVPESTTTQASPLAEVLWGGARAALVHTANFAVQDYFAKAAPSQIEEGNPETKANDHQYQGLFVAFVMVDKKGNATEVRKISDSFSTGERFKLRVVSTFNAMLTIDNLDPKKHFQRLYPESSEQAVFIRAGQEVFLPLGDADFEFDETTGLENIVITARDPRVENSDQIPAQANRKETADGSFYVLDLAKDQLPSLTQIVQIKHH